MAIICYKPPNYCSKCSHYRFDEDYGGKACWLKYDTEHACHKGDVGIEKKSDNNTGDAVT